MSRRVLTAIAALALLLVGTMSWLVRASDPEPIVAHAASAVSERAEPLDIADAGTGTEPQRIAEAPPALAPLLVRVVDQDGAAPETWWVDVAREGLEDPAGDRTDVRSSDGRRIQRIVARVSPRAAGPDRIVRAGAGGVAEIPAELRASAPRLVLQAKAFREAGVRYAESEPIAVDTSTRETITLVVADPTLLTVRVEGPRPAGDVRFDIAPIGLAPGITARGPEFAIVPDGEATFRITPTVSYGIRVSGPEAADVVETSVAGVERGREHTVLVRFPAGFAVPVPPGYAELALAGRVEFEGTDRPGLWATVDGGLPISIVVRADGRFELMHVRGSSVELHAAGDELEARFDPEVSTHPFGTRDVVVKERPVAPRVLVRLAFVAAEDGRPLPDANVRFLRRDGGRVRGKNLGGQDKAEVAVSLPALDDIELLVCARDRRDVRELLFPAGAPAAGAELPITIRLERGFHREFVVVHCSLHTPVEGVEVSLGPLYVGRSDAHGRIAVDLDEWPGRLTLRAAGFDEGQWPPAWQAPLASTTMTVCPAD